MDDLKETHKPYLKSDDGVVMESGSVDSSEVAKEIHEGNELPLDRRAIGVIVDSDELKNSVIREDQVLEILGDSGVAEFEGNRIAGGNVREEINERKEVPLAGGVDLVSEETGSLSVGDGNSGSALKGIDVNSGSSGIVDFEEKGIEAGNVAEEVDERKEVSPAGGVDLVSEENGSLPVEDGNTASELNDSLAVEDGNLAPVLKEVEPCLDLNKRVSSVSEDPVSRGIEETVLPSSNENVVEVDECIENRNMSELPESTENQPFIAVTPHPLQGTSWKSCCGLFEVLRRRNQ